MFMPTTARDSGAGEPEAPDCGAREPVSLSVLLATVESQVAQSVERDTVLDAGKQLEGKVSLKTARPFARIWNVQQKVSGANRTISDMVQDVRVNVTKAAMQLLHRQEVQAKEAEENDNQTHQPYKNNSFVKGDR